MDSTRIRGRDHDYFFLEDLDFSKICVLKKPAVISPPEFPSSPFCRICKENFMHHIYTFLFYYFFKVYKDSNNFNSKTAVLQIKNGI